MILYVDSSILVAVLFGEKGALRYERLLNKCEEALSANLTEAEVLATLSREKLDPKLARDALKTISLVFPDTSLVEHYQNLFTHGHCRGADAYHLATALYLDPSAKELVFLTADVQQRKMAVQLGFETLS